jgi:hypothetical protein
VRPLLTITYSTSCARTVFIININIIIIIIIIIITYLLQLGFHPVAVVLH